MFGISKLPNPLEKTTYVLGFLIEMGTPSDLPLQRTWNRLHSPTRTGRGGKAGGKGGLGAEAKPNQILTEDSRASLGV